uniref:Uncharacterized protein n=1 Tax=Haptolina ericina TaxID=156174 RepID=A0A7S3ERC2_9EUKA
MRERRSLLGCDRAARTACDVCPLTWCVVLPAAASGMCATATVACETLWGVHMGRQMQCGSRQFRFLRARARLKSVVRSSVGRHMVAAELSAHTRVSRLHMPALMNSKSPIVCMQNPEIRMYDRVRRRLCLIGH